MNISSLVLGVIAALTVVTATRAGDAVVADPLQLQDSQPANACDAQGAGYVLIPGTGTCVRASGQLRYQQGFSDTTQTVHGRTTMDFETRSD